MSRRHVIILQMYEQMDDEYNLKKKREIQEEQIPQVERFGEEELIGNFEKLIELLMRIII